MHFQDSPLVEEPMMIGFRQCLDKKLKETFSSQGDFLEATDLWNEQEGAFGELSYEWKRAFVAVVEQALVMYNAETSKDLVIRKNNQKLRQLRRMTIFKNNGVAKRYALQTFGSRTHGEHELVRENSPMPTAPQEADRQANANPNGTEEKQEVTGTPLEEGRSTGTVKDAKASEKAAPSDAGATVVVSRLTSTIQAGDAMANAATEIIQDKAADKVVSSTVTQDVHASPVPLVLERTKLVKIEELKESIKKATDDAMMVDEFELALESAMAEALEALGVAEEADVGLETMEEKAKDDTVQAKCVIRVGGENQCGGGRGASGGSWREGNGGTNRRVCGWLIMHKRCSLLPLSHASVPVLRFKNPNLRRSTRLAEATSESEGGETTILLQTRMDREANRQTQQQEWRLHTSSRCIEQAS